MSRKNDDILKGLKEAMEAEITGFNFYKNAAKNTTDKDGRETFSTMADEEMGHFNFLRHQYGHVLKKGEYDLSMILTKKGHKKVETSPKPNVFHRLRQRFGTQGQRAGCHAGPVARRATRLAGRPDESHWPSCVRDCP